MRAKMVPWTRTWGNREMGGAEAAAGWGWGSPEEGVEHREAGGSQGGWGQPYLGQQLGEVLRKDTKGGPTEGQVAQSGLWLHGVACSLFRILGAREAQLSDPCPPGRAGAWVR